LRRRLLETTERAMMQAMEVLTSMDDRVEDEAAPDISGRKSKEDEDLGSVEHAENRVRTLLHESVEETIYDRILSH
jgi:hypothetical protein